MTIAYVYKWTHLPTMRYYIGSRTRKNCHPDDGYLCSSREVKPMIVEHPSDWQRTILAVGSVEDMYALECNILQSMDCKNDPRSFNKHNNNFKFRYDKTGIRESEYTRHKKSIAHTGKKKPDHALKLKGKKRPEFAKLMIGKQVGANNAASKEYIIIDPAGTVYDVKCLAEFCKSMNLPLPTARDISYNKYVPKRGKMVGWKVKHK